MIKKLFEVSNLQIIISKQLLKELQDKFKLNQTKSKTMKKLLSYFMAASILLSSGSCTKEIPSGSSTGLVKIESVTMHAQDFDITGPSTKTSLTIGETGAKFSWSADDVVGVFPDIKEASQVKFPIKDGNVQEGEATSDANFTGNGWAVMEANRYMSYYPFKPDMNLDMTAIPVIYTGQSQILNNNPSRVCLYDYMAAAPTKPSFNGHIGFNFKHMNSLLVLEIAVPKPGKYTSLTLTCDDVPFITEGTLDITAETPAIKGTVTDRSLTLNLGGIETTAAGEKLTAFMMIAPMNAASKTINVRLQGPNADFNTTFIGKNYLAGKAYRPAINEVNGGDVIQLEEGSKFNAHIKSLANGENYIVEKRDYLIKNIVFQANSDGSVPELPHVDVSAESSTVPIYASWDKSTGTIYVSSTSYKVYANANAEHMFRRLKSLISVSLEDFDMSFSENINSLFEECGTIRTIDLSSAELSAIRDASRLFAGCESLEDIKWPNMTFYKDGVSIPSIFRDCKLLSSIDLHGFDGCRINDMSYAFSGCKNLKEIVLSKMDMSACGGYTGIFENCLSLRTLDVSNFGWKNIIGECCWPFQGCSSLEEINLGDFYIPNADRLESFFRGCSSLKKIDYSRFDINVKNIAYFFMECSSLKSINVDNLVKESTTYMPGLFSGCSSLENLDLSHWNTASATDINGLFSGCTKIETLDISSFKTYNVTNMGGLFSDCKNLKNIIYGDNFNTEKVTDMSNMFGNCSSMEIIDVSAFSTPIVLHFNGMFNGCSSLKEIKWGKDFDTHYAEDFSGMFQGCSSLESLDLSFFNMSSSRNINAMFAGCSKLKSLDISSFTTEHIENGMIHSTFMCCRNLAELRTGSKFNPSDFFQAFGEVAADIDGKCTIYCTETFMNNLSKDEYSAWCFDPTKVTWINCETKEPMTYPTQQ